MQLTWLALLYAHPQLQHAFPQQTALAWSVCVCGKGWDNVTTAASKRSLHHTKYLAKLLWALRMASWLPRHSPMSWGWVMVMR